MKCSVSFTVWALAATVCLAETTSNADSGPRKNVRGVRGVRGGRDLTFSYLNNHDIKPRSSTPVPKPVPESGPQTRAELAPSNKIDKLRHVGDHFKPKSGNSPKSKSKKSPKKSEAGTLGADKAGSKKDDPSKKMR